MRKQWSQKEKKKRKEKKRGIGEGEEDGRKARSGARSMHPPLS